MKTITRLSQVFLLLCIPTMLSAQLQFGWQVKNSGNLSETLFYVDSDSNDWVVTAGYFSGELYLDSPNGTITIDNIDSTYNSQDIYISMHDGAGNRHWTKRIPVTSFTTINDLILDPVNQRIHLCGLFSGQVDFDVSSSTDIRSTYNQFSDGFVTTLDYQGNYIGTTTINTPMASAFYGLKVKSNGHLILSGRNTDSLRVNYGTSSTAWMPMHGSFIMELDQNLNYSWSKSFNAEHPFLVDVEVNHDSIYVLGSFYDTIDIDLGPGTEWLYPEPNSNSTLVACYSPQGNLAWANYMDMIGNQPLTSSSVISPFYSLAVSDNGEVLIGGSFAGTMELDTATFGSTALISPLAYAFYVVKYASDGSLAWGRKWGGQSGPAGYAEDQVQGLEFFQNGDILVTGKYNGNEDFDPGPGQHMLDATNSYLGVSALNGFFAVWDNSGSFISAETFVASARLNLSSSSINTDDDVYLVGSFSDSAYFNYTNNSSLSTATWTDDFLMKLTCDRFGRDTIIACDSISIEEQSYYDSDPFLLSHSVASNGCDSITTTNLILNHSSTWTDSLVTCGSLTWIDGQTYYASTNTPTIMVSNAAGCDSVIHLNLEVLRQDTLVDQVEACEFYTWIDGNTYIEDNNTAQVVYQNALGCDSVIMLELDIQTIDVDVEVNGGTLTANQSSGSYQWIDCETMTPIPGAINQSFSPTSSGQYAVILEDGACLDTTVCNWVILDRIDEANENTISIFPNPNASSHIQLTSNEEVAYEIINLAGQVVKRGQCRSRIDINDVAEGVYTLQIETRQEHMTYRLVRLSH